jgi:hypothetical protein
MAGTAGTGGGVQIPRLILCEDTSDFVMTFWIGFLIIRGFVEDPAAAESVGYALAAGAPEGVGFSFWEFFC